MYLAPRGTNGIRLNGLGAAISTDEMIGGAKLWLSPTTIPSKMSGASLSTLLGIATPLALLLMLLKGRK